jgi:hypothetical protein
VHLLIGELTPFTFRVIIEMYVLISPFSILEVCWLTEWIMFHSFLVPFYLF